MALYTENWSDRQFKRKQSARRGWTVTGCTNEAEACAAVPVQAGASHPFDSYLIADEPEGVTKGGPLIWHVTVNYALASEIAAGSSQEVGQPAKIRWEKEYVTEPAEFDLDGHPLLMSSREAIEGLSRDILIPVLIFERMEAGFSPWLIEEYDGRFNAETLTLPHGDQYARGRVLMEITPTGETTVDRPTAPVAVQYRFKFSPPDSTWEYWRVCDMGTMAHKASDSYGSLYTVNSTDEAKVTQVSSPVRLNGAGAPWDTSLVVDRDETPLSGTVPDGAIAEDTGYATFLKYRRRKEASFASLGLTT